MLIAIFILAVDERIGCRVRGCALCSKIMEARGKEYIITFLSTSLVASNAARRGDTSTRIRSIRDRRYYRMPRITAMQWADRSSIDESILSFYSHYRLDGLVDNAKEGEYTDYEFDRLDWRRIAPTSICIPRHMPHGFYLDRPVDPDQKWILRTRTKRVVAFQKSAIGHCATVCTAHSHQ